MPGRISGQNRLFSGPFQFELWYPRFQVTNSHDDPQRPDDTREDPQQNASSGDETAPQDDVADVSPSERPAAETPEEDAGETGETPPVGDPEEELPETEPLTPELVEDEAIRGDFMMRWAVVLLAFLVALTKITDTSTLVQIRSGQHIISSGGLPPATDVFSYTASERPWVNLSWLFDVVLAGLYAVSESAVALTVLKALIVTVTFILIVHTSRSGVSTWWGSILAALAILAGYPQFTARPEVVTLLGLAVTLAVLNRWEHAATGRIWMLPGVFLLWGNLDHRMFLGLSLLLLYTAGRGIGAFLGRASADESSRQRQLWLVLGACLLAALVNPFGWKSITVPLTLYGTEYPAAISAAGKLEYLPMFDARFWERLNHQAFAGLLLLMAGLVALVLNRKSVNPSYVLVYGGFVAFAVLSGHELAPAALVACVIATLNAQEWYRDNFRQTYSVEMGELLFSRGGRAVTVLAFFGLAFLAISGRLGATTEWRIGLGFHRSLKAAMSGLSEDLKDSFDDRPFNFTLSQGDLLIWVGKKVFIDNRIALYSGSGDDDLLNLHNRTRYALRMPREQQEMSGKPEVWKSTFDRYGVTHVLPRLGGFRPPDYVTHFDLLGSPDDWQLTHLGTMTACFYRRDVADPELKQYVQEHEVDFVEQAFRKQSDPAPERPDWARPRSLYEKYFALPESGLPNAIQLAAHYSEQLQRVFEGGAAIPEDAIAESLAGELAAVSEESGNVVAIPIDLGAALAYLAIREATKGLVEDPQNALGYRILGGAYESLAFLEASIASRVGGSMPHRRRYSQAVNAYNQALLIDPDDAALRLKLIDYYYSSGKLDLALREIHEYERRTPRQGLSPEEIRNQQRNEVYKERLNEAVSRVASDVEQALNRGANRYFIALQAYRRGCVLHALQVLQEEPLLVAHSLPPQQLQAALLMESGRVEDAFDSYLKLEGVARQAQLGSWREPAAISSLANGRYPRAIRLWMDEAKHVRTRTITRALQSLPLVGSAGTWPLQHASAVANALERAPYQRAEMLVNAALCHLEAGQPQTAEAIFRQAIRIAPDTPFRPLVRFYLAHISGEHIDVVPPSQWIPVTPDIFEPESKPAPTDERAS